MNRVPAELRLKPVHMVGTVDVVRNIVTPLCGESPTPISLRYEVWTRVPSLVTCERCLAHPQFAARAAEAPK